MTLWPFQYQGFVEPPPQELQNPAQVNWRPVYPDQIAPKAGLLAAIVAGACFFVSVPAAPAQTTPAGPSGNAQVFPGQQVQYQASAQPFDAILPRTLTVDDWAPLYPNRIEPRPRLRRGLQQYETSEPLPIVFATASGSPTGSPQVFPGTQVQYQTSAKPFDAAITTRVLGPADWGPIYPDRIPPRILLGAEFQQAFGFDAAPFTTPPEGWLPTYPERIAPKPGLPVAQQQALGFHPTPEVTIARAWSAVYPDTIARRTYPTSQQLAYVANLVPEQTIARAWAPIYPDRFPPRVLPIGAMPSAFVPTYLPLTDLRWQPTYPSQIDRLVYLTANQLAFTTGLTSSVIPIADLRWQAHYPDRLDPPPRPFVQSFVFDPFPRVAVVTTLEWLPTYPTDPTRPLPVQPPFGTVLPPYVPITDLRWQGTYPSRLDPARSLLVAAQQTLAFAPRPEQTIALAWQPVYPSTIDRRVYPASQQLAFVTSPAPEQTIARGWLPIYPDAIDRRIYPAAAQLAHVLITPSVFAVPALSWQGTYPDRLYPTAGLRADLQRTFTFDPFPLPTLIVPLSWLAQYPDVIDRLTYLTANQVAWVSVASTLIWSGPVVIPCPDTGAGDPLVIIGRGW